MQSLAVKYRPKTLEAICGQTAVVKILERQVELEKIKHAYLFCGPSGTGKTTTARALASQINKGMGNPIEIDAASNSSVDNVRDIIDEAKTRALDAKYKVFIIDEAHSLSNQAWQAFLKTLEEPPEFTIFMFCTTNPEKVPATIQNRCQKFTLSKIPADVIFERLKYIAQEEHFTNYEETCDYISKVCNGGMRDAIVALEKVADYSEVLDVNNALEVLGSYSLHDFCKLTDQLIDGQEGQVLTILEEAERSGRSLKIFVNQYLSFTLDLIKYALFKDISITQLPQSMEVEVKRTVGFMGNVAAFNLIVEALLKLKNMVRFDEDAGTTIRAYFVQLLGEIKKLWANM